ncbi:MULTISPECIES: hypothetical protein [Enterobacterales]|uniref:hypothetical protein n=1 Tax=Enterobacterales TaxID=91347 RepID=UPI002EDAD01B
MEKCVIGVIISCLVFIEAINDILSESSKSGKEMPEMLTNQNTNLSMQAFTATQLAVFFAFVLCHRQ